MSYNTGDLFHNLDGVKSHVESGPIGRKKIRLSCKHEDNFKTPAQLRFGASLNKRDSLGSIEVSS